MIDDKTLKTPPPGERQVIQSYGGGLFRVSGVEYRHPILVLAERTLALPAGDIAALSVADLGPLLEADPRPEILLIGSGVRAQFVPPQLRAALKAAGVACEVMDTGAACRTYSVLLAEGRRVAAALAVLP